MFYFFRYDGSKFSYSEQIFVKSNTRETFLLGMCEGTPSSTSIGSLPNLDYAVTERLFSILLNAYIEVLAAVERRSKERARIGDVFGTNFLLVHFNF